MARLGPTRVTMGDCLPGMLGVRLIGAEWCASIAAYETDTAQVALNFISTAKHVGIVAAGHKIAGNRRPT